MFRSDDLVTPAIVAAVAALIIAVVQGVTRSSRLERLVAEYTERYGEPPPGYSADGMRVGASAGMLTGHYVIGALLGAAVDAVRESRLTRKMSAEQKELHQQISALQGWSPFHGLFMFYMWLAMMAGAAYLYKSVGGF